MSRDELIQFSLALRSIKYHPSKNTRRIFDAMPERQQEHWIELSRRVIAHLTQNGLSICKGRFHGEKPDANGINTPAEDRRGNMVVPGRNGVEE